VKLIVLKNHHPQNEITVDTTDIHELYEIYVGRSDDCHLKIDDPIISRHHFVLKNKQSKWYCEKISQLGVITIDGSLITNTEVHNGDEIKCGPYSIIVSDLIDQEVLPKNNTYDYKEKTEPVYQQEPIQTPPPKNVAAFEKEDKPLPKEDLATDEIESNEIKDEEFVEASSLDSLDDHTEEVIEEFQNSSSDEPISEFSEDLSTSSEFSDSPTEEVQGYDVATTSDDQGESTRVFKAFVNYQLVLFGEHAPYDRFQIDQDEIFIGRDSKKCQIVLNDPEVSSVHAVIRKSLSDVSLEDLNSSNGTILNGERINKALLTTGDEFVIGGTSFTLEVRSDLLDTESERLMPVESGQYVETEEIVEEEISSSEDINFDSEAPPEKSIIKRIWKDPVKRKKAIYAAAAIAVIMLFLPEEEPKESPKKPKVSKQKTNQIDKNAKPKKILSKELENARNVSYELGVSYFEQSRYDLAQVEFQKVVAIDPDYKKVQSYLEQTNVGLKRLQELEAARRAEEERIKTKKFVEELLVKAREAVKERQVQVAESFFSQITEKDPENIEVSQLKLELEAWQKEEERKALEKAAKEAARKKMVDSLTPGKTFYIKKEWYRAILKLEEFLRIQGTDEDLVKEGSEMLSDAKNQLASELGPLLGKARSLKEGQDYKAAYEAFLEILKIEPTNTEALNEADDIKSQLDARSRKIYREAIIAESLSLFTDAKEKFLEVQQISPTDSEYYKKASEKLKNYLE
jgi:pSer/pThr/pTyr-binding forkhead associated (FHA) protein